MGDPRALFTNILLGLEKQYDFGFISNNPIQNVAKYKGSIYILHDQVDKFTLIEYSEEVSDSNQDAYLGATKDLRQGPVISSSETRQEFNQMMATGLAK